MTFMRLFPKPRALHTAALKTWISETPHLSQTLTTTLHAEPLASLYATLPTRAASPSACCPPAVSDALGYGHHLVFFHPHRPESLLRADGTENDFSPPAPFTRRMWAGGSFDFSSPNEPLRVGDNVTAHYKVKDVLKKGFEQGKRPMVFVNQDIEYTKAGASGPSLVERRAHVYLPMMDGAHTPAVPREVHGIPPSYDYAFSYTPTPITLFRFSALTFNAHYIHLDKDYARHEGYSERLVHGPLTALMLLETFIASHPNAAIEHFEYQARNPQVVDVEQTFFGKWLPDAPKAFVWCADANGVVGMTGMITLSE